jgi:PAS domain S-box-containing protein
MKELENALEEVRVAQEQLIESRRRMEDLQGELQRQYEKYWQLFNEMPQPYVVTRSDSTIVEANRAASELFNVSQRFLVGKTISVFISEDRGRILTDLARLVDSAHTTEIRFRLRPRERAVLDVHARIAGDKDGLRWVITRVEPAGAPQTDASVL